jgi:hypothetical protein
MLTEEEVRWILESAGRRTPSPPRSRSLKRRRPRKSPKPPKTLERKLRILMQMR